jgi:hypothetical protein
VGFAFTGKTPTGLDMKGIARAMQKDGRVYTMIFFAPEEHYFAQLEAQVRTIFDSATF